MNKFALTDLFISEAVVINEIPREHTTADFFPIFLHSRMNVPSVAVIIFISAVTGKKYFLIIHRAVAKSSAWPPFNGEQNKKEVLNITREALYP